MSNIYKQNFKQYLGQGYSVIPDKYMQKKPAISAWSEFCHNQPTVDQATEWANTFEDSNIAVCLGEASNIIALDFDCEDPDIIRTIEHFLPQSPVEKRGAKGWTRFFRYNREITQSVKYNGAMVIELLSTGKKTTLPPSVHPNGEIYEWTTKGLLDVDQRELPLLPPYLFAHIQDRIRQAHPETVSGSGGLKNGRNNELSSLAAKLIADRVDVIQAVNKLIDFDKEINNPPLFEDLSEMRQPEPYTNALAFYTNHLTAINTKHYREKSEFELPFLRPTVEILEQGRPRADRSLVHTTCPKPMGTMGLVYDYILSNSFVKQPNFAFSAALILQATLCSRKMVFQGVSPNLYVLNVAVSGGGKDAPQQCLKRILMSANAEKLFGSGDYVSDASLMDGLGVQPVRLDIVDEASGLLRAVNKSTNEHAMKMADLLCELYTCSNDKFMGRMTATEGRKGSCYRPNINLLGSTTPKGLQEGLSRRSLDKGLVGRFLLFFGEHDRPAERVKTMFKVPEVLLDHIHWLMSYTSEKTDSIGNIAQEFTEIRANDEANAMLEDLFRWVDSSRRDCKEDNPMLPIISRMYQMLLKIALLHASSRMPMCVPVVHAVDVEFAKQTVDYYFANMKYMVEHHIFDSIRDEKVAKVITAIENVGGVISLKDLTSNTMSMDKKERQNIIDDLLGCGKVVVYHQEVPGRKTPELMIKLIGD